MVPAPAAGQAIGFSAEGVGANDWNEEPNTLASGSVPSNPYNDPSGSYPADRNGIADAMKGLGPVLVLQGKWLPYLYPLGVVGGTYSGTGMSGAATTDLNKLTRPFTGADWMFAPGTTSTFIAFYGQWSDYNGDGIRNEEGHWRNSVDGHDRQIYVRANPNDQCSEQDATASPGGSGTHILGGNPGNLVPVPVVAPVTVTKRCITPDEWAPPPGWRADGVGNPQVVSYVSPGGWSTFSGPTLRIPCPIFGWHAGPQSCVPGTPAQQRPDIAYTSGDFYGPGTYSWTSVYGQALDGSMVETKVVETIAEPALTTTGPRSHEAGPNSLIDTDIYSSLDPTVEAIFQTTLHGTFEGTQRGLIEEYAEEFRAIYDASNATSNTVDAAVNEIIEALPVEDLTCNPDPTASLGCTLNPITGTVFRQSDGVRPRETPTADHASGHHLYMDLEMRESAHVSAVNRAVSGDLGVICVGDPYSCGPAVRLVVDGEFGAWHDKNGDGWIGAPTPAAGCEDVYDCGGTRDPNVYNDANSGGEWKPACAPGRSGAFRVTLTPDGGRWGDHGAYLDYDEASNVESTQGGRASFNPYDDMVLDVADNGRVDRLYLTGDVRMVVTCIDSSGSYISFEELILLDGRTYGITMTTDPVTMKFATAGITTDETVQDTDYLAKML